MDVKPVRLEAFSQEVIPRLAALQGLSRETIPNLQQLRDIEREIQEYKKQHEHRLQHCDAQLAAVDAQYSKMKDQDRNRAKLLKKGL
jgi:plasmid maintenance system antidote protein VapI